MLGIDTATAATSVCLQRVDGAAFENAAGAGARHGAPAQARELMPAVHEVLRAGEVDIAELDVVAVGIGPGAYTGLRIGIATARALAQSLGVGIRPISSLAALAAGARDEQLALALIDARRGQLFGALWEGGERRWTPFVATPDELVTRMLRELGRQAGAPLALGNGALRSRDALEAAGALVPPDESRLHTVRALHVCRLAADVPDVAPAQVLPEYLRAPDAKPSR